MAKILKPKRLIVDTNLLLLLVIGAIEEGRHIKNSKRLNVYGINDYDNVLSLMAQYDEIYITPYIAAEVSNLIDLTGHARELAFKFAQNLFQSKFKNIEVDVVEDCKLQHFPLFGITDSSLINLAPNYYILTNDDRLLPPLFESSMHTIIPYALLK